MKLPRKLLFMDEAGQLLKSGQAYLHGKEVGQPGYATAGSV